MTKANLALLLLTTTVAAFFSLTSRTSAVNVACFNANGEIKRVYCDGLDITHRLHYRSNPNKCNCMVLDVCKTLSLRVKGYSFKDKGQSTSGIGVCQTGQPAPYTDWVCRKSGLDREWRTQTMNIRNRNHWIPAQKTTAAKHCHRLKTTPCHEPMFWNAGVDAKSIDCVRKQCTYVCDSCALTGPGNCDPGRCTYGDTTYNGQTRCNRKCRVDWKAWGLRTSATETGDGYIRLTDERSHYKEIIHAYQPGYYLALVNMDDCTFIYKNYTGWLTAPGYNALGLPSGSDSLLAKWFIDPSMKNILAVDLAVGGQSYTKVGFVNASYAPSMSAWQLGIGQKSAYIDYNHNCSISAVFKGWQTAPLTLDSFEVTSSGAAYDAATRTC